MVIYKTITISGNNVNEVRSLEVNRSIGENNVASNFTLNIDNYFGKNTGSYNIGDEIIVKADMDVNPPTTKLFTGIVEDLKFAGQGLNERLVLTGRDYTARLMDRTVEPEVYTSLAAGSIILDLINKYTDDINSGSIIATGGVVIDRIAFKHTPVFDAVKKLADLSSYTFYVDNDKYLHFDEKSQVSSGYTFNSGNILNASFNKRRDTIYNEVWVYGDRYLDGFQESFTAGSPLGGSVFTLLYNPHNTSVTVSGGLIQPGGIFGMTATAGSGIKYLVSYEDKQIIFTSGTEAGLNIPSSGNNVTIVYDRLLPVVKVGENEASKDAYKTRVKVIVDKDIKDPATAEAVMIRELEKSGEPSNEGILNIKGVMNVTPGETVVVNLPFHNVNNQVYDVLESSYEFDKINELSDNVLTVKVNKRLDDATDTIKDILLRLKKLEGTDISTTDLVTRYKSSTGSIGIRTSGLFVDTREMNDSFLVGHPINGVLGIVNPTTAGSLHSGASWATGCGIGFNRALYLPGSPAHAQSLSGTILDDFNSGTSYSISFWAATTQNTYSAADAEIIEKWAGASLAYPFVFRQLSGTNAIRFSIYDTSTNPSVNSAGSYNDGQYHHIVGVKDFTNDKILLYVDNSFIGSATDSTTGSLNNPHALFFGCRGGTQQFWTGSLDEVRLYLNKALTSNEIGSLYSKVNYPTDRLFAYYKFEEATGSIFYNSSSHEMPPGDAILLYRFNESGTTIVDEISGVVGSPLGTPGWAEGVYSNGSAVIISGNSMFNLFNENVNPQFNFNSGDSFTLAIWNKVILGSAPSAAYGIFGKGNNGTLGQYAIDIQGANTYRVGVRSGAFVKGVNLGTAEYNQWYHLGMTYDASPSHVYGYLNGSLIGSVNVGGSPLGQGGSLIIGRLATRDGATGSAMVMYVDEPRIYNRVLSSNEMLNLYQGKTIQPLLGDRGGSFSTIWSGGY